MHYNQAGNVVAKKDTVATYTQEIEVINREDALYIRHHFSELPSGRHEIVWPATSISHSCYTEEAPSCSRLDESATAFVEGENNQQSISYEIPKDRPMLKTRLFKESFVALRDASAVSTLFHLTDETKNGGLWVNGLKRVGHKKMEHIDYSLFRGAGEVKDLYWQKDDLPILYDGDRLTVYSAEKGLALLKEADAALKEIKAKHSTVVIDANKPALEATRFSVVNHTDIADLSDSLLSNAIHSRFSISNKEDLTAEVTAAILIQKATGSKRSRKAYSMLTESLSTNELEKLRRQLVVQSGNKLNAKTLDKMIGVVTGYKTEFFARNGEGSRQPLHPFLIEDPRKVKVDSSVKPEIGVVLKDGKEWYPAREILSSMGYKVTSNKQSLYIENEVRKFRFPMKELFYVYNEQRYDLSSTPFKALEGDYYFEENAFIRFFLLSIEKSADSITIISKTSFKKGG